MSTWKLGEKVVIDNDRQALYAYSEGVILKLPIAENGACALNVNDMHVVTGEEKTHAGKLLLPLGHEFADAGLDDKLCEAEMSWNYDDTRDRLYVRPDALDDTYCILRVEGPYRPPYHILRAEDTMTFTGANGDCFTHGDPDGYTTLREALCVVTGADPSYFEPSLED